MNDSIHVSGNQNQVATRGSTVSQVIGAADIEEHASRYPSGAARHLLHAFADIVGYSQLTARLQKVSQDYLASVLDDSMAEAGVQPELVARQDQGDAILLTFPTGTDAARVLATMPRYLNDELLDRNQDMAPHARIRIRTAFSMGVSMPGGTGLVGQAPITVARLANWATFRHAMTGAAQAQCGVIIDDHLHGEYVRQRFRPDIDPGEYVPAHVAYADKGFNASAWVKLFGYSGQQVAALLARP
jgi:class 3 adenylate cyclase